MMEWLDTAPEVNVADREYRRLLGYPPGVELTERARELASWARDWYARCGRPWVYAREAASVDIDGLTASSRWLRRTFEQAEAHSAILVALSAGGEVEAEARRLWEDEKPDEYFFLDVLGAAVVEHLMTTTGARLCAWADEQGLAVLPHYSPGYPEWDIGEQGQLLALIRRSGKMPGSLEALESGALRPTKSQLAVFGVTRHTERARRLTELVPCTTCSYHPCVYRRRPEKEKS